MHQVSRASDSITVSWPQPDQANGNILDYQLRYYDQVRGQGSPVGLGDLSAPHHGARGGGIREGAQEPCGKWQGPEALGVGWSRSEGLGPAGRE